MINKDDLSGFLCSHCIYDDNVPAIEFDEQGVCNYCRQVDSLKDQYGTGELKGKSKLDAVIQDIKSRGKGKTYDCVIGVSGGSANTYIVQTKEELKMFAQYLLSYFKSFIAQQYIGTPDSEYTIGVLFSMEGELLNSIAVKRNILSGLSNTIKIQNATGNPEFGPILTISSGISQGEIGKFSEVTKQAEFYKYHVKKFYHH
jgi:hypothetical protein